MSGQAPVEELIALGDPLRWAAEYEAARARADYWHRQMRAAAPCVDAIRELQKRYLPDQPQASPCPAEVVERVSLLVAQGETARDLLHAWVARQGDETRALLAAARAVSELDAMRVVLQVCDAHASEVGCPSPPAGPDRGDNPVGGDRSGGRRGVSLGPADSPP